MHCHSNGKVWSVHEGDQSSKTEWRVSWSRLEWRIAWENEILKWSLNEICERSRMRTWLERDSRESESESFSAGDVDLINRLFSSQKFCRRSWFDQPAIFFLTAWLSTESRTIPERESLTWERSAIFYTFNNYTSH